MILMMELMSRSLLRRLTQDEEGELGVLQIVHHHHVSGKIVPHGEKQLRFGGRGAVHDAQVVLPEKRQRGHGDALHLTVAVFARVLVAVQSADIRRQKRRKEADQSQRQQLRARAHVDARHLRCSVSSPLPADSLRVGLVWSLQSDGDGEPSSG